MDIERNLAYGRFEPVPGYRNPQDSPFVVVPQTSTVLDMYLNGQINDPKPAVQFLNEATFPYLDRAQQGLQIASTVCEDRKSIKWTDVAQSVVDPVECESLEALGYMLVVFVFMPELPSEVLPQGFSRKGNLRPPETKKELSFRVDELRKNVQMISEVQSPSGIPMEGMAPPLMRTLAFFRTGDWLPFKFPDDTLDYMQREYAQIDRLLGDVVINL